MSYKTYNYKADVNPSHVNIEKIQPVTLSMNTNKGVGIMSL